MYCIASSPFDDDLIATGGGDDRVRLFSISSGEMLHELPPFEDSVIGADFQGREFQSTLSGNEVHYTNALVFLMKIMLCSKHYHKVFN